jgi:hypothetical protein
MDLGQIPNSNVQNQTQGAVAMIMAQILKGIIQNIIVLDDASLIPIFQQGFDFLVDITNLSPQPQIGDSYDGKTFTPNTAPNLPAVVPNISVDTPTRDSLILTPGMMIFNSDVNQLQYYNGTKWISL